MKWAILLKIDKLCPICKHNIAGTGANWRFPLYSHIARKHFPDELIKNYAMGEEANLSCRLCGKVCSMSLFVFKNTFMTF